MVSATIGVSSLFLGGVLSSPYSSTWVAWWVGDALSNIITAPFLLVWSRRTYPVFRLSRAIELMLLSASVVVVGLLFLESFMAVVAITSMILAAVISERGHLEKQKDDFISFASHELKTLITSIKLFTQTLQKVLSKSNKMQESKYTHRIDDQVNKLVVLINDMLDCIKDTDTDSLKTMSGLGIGLYLSRMIIKYHGGIFD